MKRREFLGSAGALAVSGLSAPAIGQSSRSRTLRYVPAVNLTFLDPYSTTAIISTEHGYNVFDTLYALDSTVTPRPQMAEGHTLSPDGRTYEIKLREGLFFHDGEPVRAADCVASLRRWMSKDSIGKLVAERLDAMQALDDRTLRIQLKKPFPALLYGLAKAQTYAAFILPERLAAGDPAKPVTEMVGSGPFRFIAKDYQPGHLVAYEKFDRYRPRQEPANWLSGGKVAHFQRVEWRILPDAATAVSALRAGEVDWLQVVEPDLIASLKRNRDVVLARREPTGWIRMLRFNHLVPPFNDVKMRQAVMLAVDQRDYLAQATGGLPDASQVCHSFYACGMPYGKASSPDPLAGTPNLARARALVAEAGYKGEKVVLLNPVDLFGPMGQLSKSVLESIGINVELVDVDWGTLLQRRANRGPAASGGWNIVHSFWTGLSIANPVENLPIRGQGETGWPGWYRSEKMEALVSRWANAASEAEQAAIAAETQKLAFEEVPSVFTGVYYEHSAHRRSIQGVITAPATPMWNVRPS